MYSYLLDTLLNIKKSVGTFGITVLLIESQLQSTEIPLYISLDAFIVLGAGINACLNCTAQNRPIALKRILQQFLKAFRR
jgi:hypothetical protein